MVASPTETVLERRIVMIVCDDSSGLGNALQGLTLIYT